MKNQLPYGQSDYALTMITELRLVLGAEAADKIGRAFAGRREHIPNHGTEKYGSFCEQFGEAVAEFVADFAGGREIEFPSLNSIEMRARIIARRADLESTSMPINDVAHKWGITRRWAGHLRRQLLDAATPPSGKSQ